MTAVANEPLQAYIAGLDASDDFKTIFLRIHGLSRRKREQMTRLVNAEYESLEFDPEAAFADVDHWLNAYAPTRRAWFVVLGLLLRHSVVSPRQLRDDVAKRTLALLDALDQAQSAADVAAIPHALHPGESRARC